WDFLRAGGLGAPPPEPLEQRLALGVERRVILGGGRAALARGRRYVVHLQRDGLAVVERLRAERRQLHDRVLAAGDAEVALEDELLVEAVDLVLREEAEAAEVGRALVARHAVGLRAGEHLGEGPAAGLPAEAADGVAEAEGDARGQ